MELAGAPGCAKTGLHRCTPTKFEPLTSCCADKCPTLCCRELGVEEPEAPSGPGRRSAFKLNSVGAQFRSQLKGLMATLSACQPHYVR